MIGLLLLPLQEAMADYMKSLRRHSVAAAAAEAARQSSSEVDQAIAAEAAAAKARSEEASAAAKAPPLQDTYKAAVGPPVRAAIPSHLHHRPADQT